MSLHLLCKNRWVYWDHLALTPSPVRATQTRSKQNKNQHYQFTERTTFKRELTELKIQEENPTVDLTTLNKKITNHVTSAGRNYPRIINFHVQQRM